VHVLLREPLGCTPPIRHRGSQIDPDWREPRNCVRRLALTFTPSRVTVSASGDLAYDAGTYKLGYDLPNGKHYDDVGKGGGRSRIPSGL
jgi:hypothetical protein